MADPEMEWEEMEWDHSEDALPQVVTERTKVPGGWLIRSYVVSYEHKPCGGVGLTFVPDTLYRWDAEKPFCG